MQFTDRELRAIKKIIDKGIPQGDVDAFIALAEGLGLNPLGKEIYLLPRKSRKEGTTGQITIGISGMRRLAYQIDPGYGSELQWHDGGGWSDCPLEEKPVAAKCILTKTSGKQVVRAVAWSEYAGDNVWNTKPCTMLGKCAEMAALRAAFPMRISEPEEEVAFSRREEGGEEEDLVSKSQAEELRAMCEGLDEIKMAEAKKAVESVSLSGVLEGVPLVHLESLKREIQGIKEFGPAAF